MLLAAVLCMALSFITCFEKKLDLNSGSLSYIHDSPEIKDMVLRYVKNLQRYYVYYANFDIDKANAKLEEIDNFIQTGKIETKQKDYSVIAKPFVDIESDGESSDQNSDQSSDEDKISVSNPEDLYDFDINTVTVDTLLDYQTKLSDAISNYDSVKDYIYNNNDFHFLLYSNKLGHIIATNSDLFYTEECYDSVALTDTMFNVDFNGETLINSFRNMGYSCEISIPVTTSTNVKTLMATLHRQLDNNKIFASNITTAVLALASLILVLFTFLCDRSFLKEFNHSLYSIFAKIPMIVQVPVMVGIVQNIVRILAQSSPLLTEMVIYGKIGGLIVTIFSVTLSIEFTFLFLEHILLLITNRHRIMQLPDIQFLVRGLNDCKIAVGAGKMFFAVVMFFLQITIVGLACVLFLMLTNYYMLRAYILMLWLIIFILVILYNGCASEVKLRYYIQQMANGHMEVVPEQSGLFSNSINQLNCIRGNFQKNLDETLRSERLKTDLITNVSHDLKTPLTSIISYVDLLSALPDNSEEAKQYIEVIKNKSRRLKILIDDLFEASKLSSGQMKLERRDSDIVSLLEQTLGELSYKIDASGIEFVVTNSESPIIVNMDGERMWRVFDNLINNILKYSPKNSRAYIDLTKDDKSVTIVFKNVANYHMEFNADELFERFKRGDIARTTEGSGLGLSIAKSIVELHGGSMNIVTDGDLFKIKVVLSLRNEEEAKENKEAKTKSQHKTDSAATLETETV